MSWIDDVEKRLSEESERLSKAMRALSCSPSRRTAEERELLYEWNLRADIIALIWMYQGRKRDREKKRKSRKKTS